MEGGLRGKRPEQSMKKIKPCKAVNTAAQSFMFLWVSFLDKMCLKDKMLIR
jgi:hypothetical protein